MPDVEASQSMAIASSAARTESEVDSLSAIVTTTMAATKATRATKIPDRINHIPPCLTMLLTSLGRCSFSILSEPDDQLLSRLSGYEPCGCYRACRDMSTYARLHAPALEPGTPMALRVDSLDRTVGVQYHLNSVATFT